MTFVDVINGTVEVSTTGQIVATPVPSVPVLSSLGAVLLAAGMLGTGAIHFWRMRRLS